jgi:phospholipid-binding lipoprotein MlaA
MGPYLSLTGPQKKDISCLARSAFFAVAFLTWGLFSAWAMAQPLEKDLAQNPRQANPKDPWEGFNRSMFRLNDQIDQSVTRPLAQAYVDVTPSLVRKGVRNFFGNISDFWSAANSALQFKPLEATEGLMRVMINTTIGVYGLMDWATPMKLERHTEDFGQTLGVWGVPSGPYVVLPLLGPSTLRDSSALLALDVKATPIQRVRPSENKYELTALNLTDKRAKYLGLEQELEEAALDRYSFVRDVYLQKRRSDIYDGEPPTEKEEDFSR